MIPPMVGFIGWHDAGKTTLASRVVALLHDRGYRVAVIKSTKERGAAMEPEQADTAIHRRCGADPVLLLAPDQVLLRARPEGANPFILAERYCHHVDLVVVEGCKHAVGLAKIEVRRDAAAPLLRDEVDGVIAVATDLPLAGGLVFGLDQAKEIADLIEARFLGAGLANTADLRLLINGEERLLDEEQRHQLQRALGAIPDIRRTVPANASFSLRIEWDPSCPAK